MAYMRAPHVGLVRPPADFSRMEEDPVQPPALDPPFSVPAVSLLAAILVPGAACAISRPRSGATLVGSVAVLVAGLEDQG
jgi:hypothetical protein